jgi:hypothetical protein
MDKFITYLFSADDSFTFIELNTDYTETIEAYGYSKTYVYEVVEPGTYEISIYVDNELDFNWYSDYFNDENESKTVTHSFFGSARVYTYEVTNNYIVIEFESFDIDNPSELSFMLTILEEID